MKYDNVIRMAEIYIPAAVKLGEYLLLNNPFLECVSLEEIIEHWKKELDNLKTERQMATDALLGATQTERHLRAELGRLEAENQQLKASKCR